MSDGDAEPDDVSNRRILREVIVYGAVVLAAGAIFVAFRVRRDGARVLTATPHTSQPQTEPAPR